MLRWVSKYKKTITGSRTSGGGGANVDRSFEFDLGWLADGLDTRREVRTLQANHGVSIVGPLLEELSRSECETKYQRAVKITERLVTLGCSSDDDLPYFVA